MAVCVLNFLQNYSTKPSEVKHALDTVLAFASTKVVDLTDSFINGLQNITVENFKKFSENNNKYMKRLMEINLMQRQNIISNIGIDAHQNGIADTIIPTAQKPSYVEGNNYLDFVKNIQAKELIGENSTRSNSWSINGEPRNLYPDELDAFSRGQGTENIWSWKKNSEDGYTSTSESSFDVWNVDCDQNSILAKTKRLFKEKKINTIIARFGTGADYVSPVKYNGQVATQYGESRGRNLLTKEAESWKNTGIGKGYNINGYKNPYCRVWTHHYKYDSLYKTMRPFSESNKEDGRGGLKKTMKLKDVNSWKNGFQDGYKMNNPHIEFDDNGNEKVFNKEEEKHKNRKVWGWRSSHNKAYEKSVMSDGLINFAPMYGKSGENKIHTRDCMFSIENLAWKDFSPYDFETALSWEQRGPNGGRIMWFPPYGLTFNETTQAQWQSHQFIGRGEDVYTYTNTVRSGNLSFLMVVDHPSIIDYVFGIHNQESQIALSDNDVHRYFAGCDINTLKDSAKPTPLTDEYRKSIVYDVANEVYESKGGEPPQIEAPKNIDPITITCYFPTNYSGHYDSKEWDGLTNNDRNCYAWAYMLIGCYSNFFWDEENKCLNSDIYIQNSPPSGRGYKMGEKWGDITDGDNASGYVCRYYKTKNGKIIQDCSYRRYYRIDTQLTTGKIDNTNKDTINQTNSAKNKKSFDDGHSTKWNLEGYYKKDDANNYSFFDFCWAMLNVHYKDKYTDFINKLNDIYETRINSHSKNLVEVFEKIKNGEITIDKIEIDGCSDESNKRQPDAKNQNLAQFRGEFFKELIKPVYKEDSKITIKTHASTTDYGKDKAPNRVSIMKIYFTNSEKQLNADPFNANNKTQGSNDTEESTIISKSYISDYNITYNAVGKLPEGTTFQGRKYAFTLYQSSAKRPNIKNNKNEDVPYYKGRYFNFKEDDKVNNNGYLWININEGVDGKEGKYEMRLYHKSFLENGDGGYEIMDRSEEKNTLRYDQEYYFFKKLETKDNITFKKLVQKLQYFDPAFHSMTPEGFNGRLTFLNQCMRQGDTLVAIENKPNSTQTKDDDAKKSQMSTANNLAFGRPPFCVLRIGDFYNQMIIIESLNINYDFDGGIKWDLNSEGIGVQPLLAQVNLGIKFIGGGDISGPIRRLQNAMSFNYYANTTFYDNRADRMAYEIDERTGKQSLKKDTSYMHNVNRNDGDIINITNDIQNRVVKHNLSMNNLPNGENNNIIPKNSNA